MQLARKIKPVLIFGYGNLSRGDDALGPLFLQHIEAFVNLENIDILSDYQLQIEHALDLADRQLVLFVDASVAGSGAFVFSELSPCQDNSYSTHAMSPAAVLAVYQKVNKYAPPPSFLLSITGERFELGEGLSASAQNNLNLARDFAGQLFGDMDAEAWRRLAAKVNKSTAYA